MSKVINTSAWGEFHVRDLFEVVKSSRKLSLLDLADSGRVPVYSTESTSGGVAGFTDREADFEVTADIPHFVVFGEHTRAMNVVTADFCVTDNVKVLRPRTQVSEMALRFALSSWGKAIPDLGYARHWSVAAKATVPLPITPAGEPDWAQMEQIMREVSARQKQALAALQRAAATPETVIDSSDWGEFKLVDICEIDSGSKLDFGKMRASDAIDAVGFVGRTAVNNGLMGNVERVSGAKIYEPGSITLALGGSIGACFVQDARFHTSQNVAVLRPHVDVDTKTKQFLATAIRKESSLNYQAFVKELNAHIRNGFTIKLPITAAGEPAWELMAQKMQAQIERAEAKLAALRSIADTFENVV